MDGGEGIRDKEEKIFKATKDFIDSFAICFGGYFFIGRFQNKAGAKDDIMFEGEDVGVRGNKRSDNGGYADERIGI